MTREPDDKKRLTDDQTDDPSFRDIEHEKYIGRTNVADYNVPSGVQLTENLIEEIAEGVGHKTPETPPEK